MGSTHSLASKWSRRVRVCVCVCVVSIMTLLVT